MVMVPVVVPEVVKPGGFTEVHVIELVLLDVGEILTLPRTSKGPVMERSP